MRALVVYESMFGTTGFVADAVAEGLADRLVVDVAEVGAAPPSIPGDVALLVVGGPTHAFGLSRVTTRQSAARRPGYCGGPVDVGLREWMGSLSPLERPLAVAAFDTRARWPRVPGSAARAACRTLRAKGGHPIGHRTFWVTGTLGPMAPGEEGRARLWGEDLGRRVETAALAG